MRVQQVAQQNSALTKRIRSLAMQAGTILSLTSADIGSRSCEFVNNRARRSTGEGQRYFKLAYTWTLERI